jgi:hypothetical protein
MCLRFLKKSVLKFWIALCVSHEPCSRVPGRSRSLPQTQTRAGWRRYEHVL